jgi:hypothetical protein
VQRDPALQRVIRMAFDCILANVHTCMPGKIESFDKATGLAKVKPLLMRKYVKETAAKELPVISGVPVLFPRLGTAVLRFPVTAGDYVSLFFAERSLDKWLAKGGMVDPEDPARFALNDAIAVLGLYPKTEVLTANGADTSLELALGTSWIEIKTSGEILVKNGSNKSVTLKSDGEIDLQADANTKIQVKPGGVIDIKNSSVTIQISGTTATVTAAKVVLDSSDVELGGAGGSALALKSDLGLIVVTAPNGPCVVNTAACIGTLKVKGS